MAGLYEDLVKDLEEIIAMENGKNKLEEIPNMPAKTYAPQLLREESTIYNAKE